MAQGNLLGLRQLVGCYPRLLDLVENLQDELLRRFTLRRLNRCIDSE